MDTKFENKRIIYIVQQTLLVYIKIIIPDTKNIKNNQNLEELIDYFDSLNIFLYNIIIFIFIEKSKVFLNINKKTKYQKNIRIIKFYLLQKLNNNDQVFLNEYNIPKTLQEYLKNKYNQLNKFTAAKYTKKFYNFIWNNNFIIIDVWNKFKKIYRKIITVKLLIRT